MKFANLVKICLWPHLEVKRLKGKTSLPVEARRPTLLKLLISSNERSSSNFQVKGRTVRFLTWRCLEKLAVHLSWTDTSVTGVTGRNDQGQARMSTLGMVCRTRRRDKNILKWSRTGSDKYSTTKWWETKRRQKCLQLNNNDKEHKERGANRKTRSQQWFLMTKIDDRN